MRIKYNKVGNTPVKSYQVGYTIHIAAYFCPHCGAEIYGQWNIKKEEQQPAIHEASSFSRLDKCPQCGRQLIHEKGYFLQGYAFENTFFKNDICCVNMWAGKPGKYYFSAEDVNSTFEYLAKERMSVEKEKLADRIQDFLKPLERTPIAAISAQSATAIKETSASLHTYLHQIVRLESNIYALTKRLESLYYQHMLISRIAVAAKHEPAEHIRKETANAKLAIQPLIEALHAEQTKPLPQVRIGYPKKPTAPCAPSAPTLETPGFFNKKKVLAENEAKTARYNREVEEYQQKMADYESAVAAYERQRTALQAEEQRQKEENSKRRDAAIQKAQDALDIAQSKYDELKDTEDARIAEAATMPVPADTAVEMLEKEMTEAERLLKELFTARNTLYAYNVVFPKYRNIVALSTFCEYLVTGRCDSLEGANGAYNLYESECRADMIISQLSVVIDSLEQVKQNQYMIYSELQNIRSDLADLNSTMNAALKSIRSIDTTTAKMSGQMEKIAENTSVIAHNTAVTAYYSKVNAELTNALGYMVAFK